MRGSYVLIGMFLIALAMALFINAQAKKMAAKMPPQQNAPAAATAPAPGR